MSELVTSITLPSFTPADLARDRARPKLKAGVGIRFLIQKAGIGTWDKSGFRYAHFDVAPVGPENRPTYPTAQFNMAIPFTNPEAVGLRGATESPNTIKQWRGFLHALNPTKFKRLPKKVGNIWMTQDGEELTSYKKVDEYTDVVNGLVRSALIEYCKDVTQFVGEAFIGVMKDEKDVKNPENVYRNVDVFKFYPLNNPPTDITVLEDDFTE